MHPDDQHLLVVRPVEDADSSPAGQPALVTPEEVVLELLRRRFLEAAARRRRSSSTTSPGVTGARCPAGEESASSTGLTTRRCWSSGCIQSCSRQRGYPGRHGNVMSGASATGISGTSSPPTISRSPPWPP